MFVWHLTGKILSFEFYPKAVIFECKFRILQSVIAHVQNWPIGLQRVGPRIKWHQRLTSLKLQRVNAAYCTCKTRPKKPEISKLPCCLLAELRRPEGPPRGAPYPYRKLKETHKLIFSGLSWLAVLIVGAYARRRRWRLWSRARWRQSSK